MIDTETPVEAGPREPLPAPVPVAAPLSPLMQKVADATAAAQRGELTRVEPIDPVPVTPHSPLPENYQPPYVPREYRQAAFEKFDEDIAGPEHKSSLALALRSVKRWVSAAKQDRRAMLAIIGSQGNGKSHLLYSAVNLLAMNGARVFSRPWYRLADELRYGGPSPFQPNGPDIESFVLRRQLYYSRIVVIDEVRPTAGTAFDDTELAKFACHAWDEGIAVLITSNVSPLSNVMGEAAADRFTCITLNAPSRRQA